MSTRTASRSRTTKETSIDIELAIDGEGRSDVTTGLPFFDHMLDQLGRHGGFDLKVHAEGDIEIDAHHTVEDVGIALGECFKDAWATRPVCAASPLLRARSTRRWSRRGPRPVGAAVPALRDRTSPARRSSVTRRSIRSWSRSSGGRSSPRRASRCTRCWCDGKNTHHIIESTFKSTARALRDAVRVEGGGIPSTKGVL